MEEVKRLKRQPGKDIGVPGGVRTAQTFVRLGCLTNTCLWCIPSLSAKASAYLSRELIWS